MRPRSIIRSKIKLLLVTIAVFLITAELVSCRDVSLEHLYIYCVVLEFKLHDFILYKEKKLVKHPLKAAQHQQRQKQRLQIVVHDKNPFRIRRPGGTKYSI
jgi:hypothetical protein